MSRTQASSITDTATQSVQSAWKPSSGSVGGCVLRLRLAGRTENLRDDVDAFEGTRRIEFATQGEAQALGYRGAGDCEALASADERSALLAEALRSGRVKALGQPNPEVPGGGDTGSGGRAENGAGVFVPSGTFEKFLVYEFFKRAVSDERERGGVVRERGAGSGVLDDVLDRGGKARRGDEETGACGGCVALAEATNVEGAFRREHGVAGRRGGLHVAVGVIFDEDEVEVTRDLHDVVTASETGNAAERVVHSGHGVDGSNVTALAGLAQRSGGHAVFIEVERGKRTSQHLGLLEDAGIGDGFYGDGLAGETSREQRDERTVVAAAGDPGAGGVGVQPSGSGRLVVFAVLAKGRAEFVGIHWRESGDRIGESLLPLRALGGQQWEIVLHLDHGFSDGRLLPQTRSC
jgi:hypothetical protein